MNVEILKRYGFVNVYEGRMHSLPNYLGMYLMHSPSWQDGSKWAYGRTETDEVVSVPDPVNEIELIRLLDAMRIPFKVMP